MTDSELSVRLAPAPPSVSEARRFVRDVLSVWAIDGEFANIVALLTCELVTNALLHAVPPIDVDLKWNPPRLRVAVSDGTEQLPRITDVPRPAGRGGFGLHIIERLAHNWGAGRQPHGGKVVWFEIEPTIQIY